MSKKKESFKVQGTEENLPVIANYETATQDGVLIDLAREFENQSGFSEVVNELFSKELLYSLKDVTINAFLRSKGSRKIKEEYKDGVEMQFMTDSGIRTVFATQFAFIAAFDEHDRGAGVLIQFTYRGKEEIKGSGRTVNKFDMKVKSIKQ